MVGEIFGRLTILTKSHSDKRHKAYWKALCECGKETVARGDSLKNGKTKSCGCLQREFAISLGASSRTHGQRADRSPTYNTWAHMIDRCENPKNGRFGDYGGRGIFVCNRWHSFEEFREDMGDKPDGLTLERVNNNEGYSPDNCEWASYTAQNQNRRPFGVGVRAQSGRASS